MKNFFVLTPVEIYHPELYPIGWCGPIPPPKILKRSKQTTKPKKRKK